MYIVFKMLKYQMNENGTDTEVVGEVGTEPSPQVQPLITNTGSVGQSMEVENVPPLNSEPKKQDGLKSNIGMNIWYFLLEPRIGTKCLDVEDFVDKLIWVFFYQPIGELAYYSLPFSMTFFVCF